MIHRMVKRKEVYLIGFYPHPETNPDTKYLIDEAYLSLGRSYDCNIQVVTDPEEVFNLRTLPHVSIEGPNDVAAPLAEFVHPPQAVYLVGNLKYRRPSYFVECEYMVQIPVVDPPHQMYGFQAAAIVLHDRLMKNAGI